MKSKTNKKPTRSVGRERRSRSLQRRVSLSFKVEEITERKLWGVTIHDTVLVCYGGLERITLRGKHWSVGTKVDFQEIATG